MRGERSLSREELSRRTGLSRSTLWRIEAGRVRPHAATVVLLALALDCDPAVLAVLVEKEAE